MAGGESHPAAAPVEATGAVGSGGESGAKLEAVQAKAAVTEARVPPPEWGALNFRSKYFDPLQVCLGFFSIGWGLV